MDRILIEALTSGASDIHVEPQENTLEIRFRLDGVLQKHFEDLPKSLTPAVTSRIKIMAHLDISEKRNQPRGRGYLPGLSSGFEGFLMEHQGIAILPSSATAAWRANPVKEAMTTDPLGMP